MVRWMATRYLGGVSDIPIGERCISAQDHQPTCWVSWTWRGRSIKWGDAALTWKKWKCLASYTYSSKGDAILSSARPSSSFEVVAHQVFCWSFEYFLHVCGNGQQWGHRNASQIPTFIKSLCVCNYTQSGWDRAQSHSSKPCGNNLEVLGIEWAAPGIYTGCPTGAKQSSTHMAMEHRTQCLW